MLAAVLGSSMVFLDGTVMNLALAQIGAELPASIVVVSGTFYAALASSVPGLDASDPALRAAVQPLNPPATGAPMDIAEAARVASFDALRLAAIACAALLAAGSLVNGIGLRRTAWEDEDEPAAAGSADVDDASGRDGAPAPGAALG